MQFRETTRHTLFDENALDFVQIEDCERRRQDF